MNDSSVFFTQEMIIILVGFAVVIGTGILLWRLSKDLKGMDFGEAMAVMAVDKHETINIIAILFLFIFSAITAASILPPDGQPLNPFAKVGSHIMLNIVGASCSITLVREWALVFMPFISWTERLRKIIMALAITVIGFFMVYKNLWLAVDTAGKMYEFELWWYHLIHGQQAYEQLLIQYGQPTTVRASSLLPPAIGLLIAEAQAHFAVIMVEGLRNVLTKTRRELLFEKAYRDLKIDPVTGKSYAGKPAYSGPEGDKGAKSPTAGEERHSKDLPKNARMLMDRIGYTGAKLDNITKDIETAILKVDDQDTRFALGSKLAKFAIEAKNIDANGGNDKKAKNDDLIKRLYEFVQAPMYDNSVKPPRLLAPDKCGLNITLKGGKK